ncbi:hypothetical protein FRC07_005923 [Ceratobasidium sp. 392]|nr:hypothetical protein FRC07_005923 [Ceratobasidium sp. 392]
MTDSTKAGQLSSSEIERPLLDKNLAENEKTNDSDKPEPQAAKPHYRERQLGVWTLYYLTSGSWLDSIPTSLRAAHHRSEGLSAFQEEALGSRLDLAVAENPDVQSRFDKAIALRSRAWAILESLAELISICVESIGHASVLAQMLRTREDAKLFGFICIARPLISQVLYYGAEKPYYAVVTNYHWLRMGALYKLGTSIKLKKEVLSGGLDDFINSRTFSTSLPISFHYSLDYVEYAKDIEELGDACGDNPPRQLYRQKPIGYEDVEALFDAIPFLLFAWGNIHNHSSGLSLTSLVMVQQAASAYQAIIWRIVYSGRRIWDLFDNVVALYEVLEIKPAMKDGEIVYPDDEHTDSKGATIEFSTSGTVLVDNRPINDYKISTLRAATNVMYQDYQHLPLTVKENILLGCPNSKNLEKDVDEASKLGGTYEFIQKLPLKFDTNLEPEKNRVFQSRLEGERH